MEVIHGTTTRSSSSSSSSSTLNPNAPMFVPLAYRTVEDFSDEWWSLVHSSPWFRDYWLRERFQDPQIETDTSFSEFDFDFDEDFLFHHQPQEEEEERKDGKELISMGALKWEGERGRAEAPRYAEKVPKFVKPRLSPRAIHQPR